MVLSAPSFDATIALLLEQAAVELAQDQHLIRIKKLVFYLCTETWETDRQRLDQLCLRRLLQQLLDTALTLESLQQQLNHTVSTLNKVAEYTIVANTLISRLHPIYAASQQEPQINPTFYQTIAKQLESAPAQIRIKKLLLLTCRSTWDNNTHHLEQLNLTQLLQELHQIAPTVEAVRSTLYQVAQALSKPEAYAAVAETIAVAFQFSDLNKDLSNHADTDTTQLKTQPNPPTQAESLPHWVKQRQPPQLAAEQGKPSSVTPTAADTDLELMLIQPPTNLFDLRLAIMQDTNPYKVKVLLFSLLHEPFQPQHESLLKTHEIDDLLRALLLTYQLYAEAAKKLRQMASLLGTDHYTQAAEAVLRGIELFYGTQVHSTPGASLELGTIDPTQMKPATPEMTQPDRL